MEVTRLLLEIMVTSRYVSNNILCVWKTIFVSQGAVHEVPALFAAPALDTQENSNGGALTVGTSAVVKYSLSKREAEADPALFYSVYPYAYGAYPYAYGAYSAYHPYAYWG